MNKLPIPRLPANGDYQNLAAVLVPLLTAIVAQINALGEGRIYARYTGTTAPTTGTWAVGDIVYNSAVSELGAAGSKYMIEKWTCVAAGTPGTWKESRVLTGA